MPTAYTIPARWAIDAGRHARRRKLSEWPAREQQRFRNVEAMFARGVDPYARLLAQAKYLCFKTLLSYRMNDAHGFAFLH